MKATVADSTYMHSLGWYRPIHIALAYAKLTLKDTVRYRVDALVKLVGYPLRVLMVVFLWRTLMQGGAIHGRTFEDVVVYYVLAFLFATMYPFVRVARDIRDEIFNGDISLYLARGVPHASVHAARYLTNTLIHLVLTVPAVALVLTFSGALTLTPAGITQFLVLVVIGLTLKALIWYAIGLASFLFEDNFGVIRIVSTAEEFLSGALLPLYFFPALLREVAGFLPFQFTLYAPIDALTSPHPRPELLLTCGVGITWVVVLILLNRTLMYYGLKRFTMHGA